MGEGRTGGEGRGGEEVGEGGGTSGEIEKRESSEREELE